MERAPVISESDFTPAPDSNSGWTQAYCICPIVRSSPHCDAIIILVVKHKVIISNISGDFDYDLIKESSLF